MSELFTNSQFFLIAQVIAIGIVIKTVVFPLIDNLTLNTKNLKAEPTISLADVFHEYNHANIEEWYKWISKQKPKTQDFAFKKLIQYLDLSPEFYTPILNDVIKVITAFKKPGTETAIFKLLQKISVPNPPQEFYNYYAKALKALVELNAERASSFLDEEYRKYHKNPEYVKRFVYVSSFFPSNRLPIKLLTSYLLNSAYLINDRIRLLETLKEKPDSFYEIAVAILEKLLDNKDIEPEITEYCYINLLKIELLSHKEFSKTLKTLFNKAWVSDHLFSLLKNYLINNEKSDLNPISLAIVITSINPLNYDSLKDLLYEKFEITPNEDQLIKQVDILDKLKQKSKLKLEKAINFYDSSNEELPDFLLKSYEGFSKFCFDDKYSSFKLISGDNELEKNLLIAKLANEENKKIIVLSIEKLVADQTLLDNLESHLKTILNKILYIPGFEVLIKELAARDDSNNVYRKILNRFKFLVLKSNIPIIASCNNQNLDLKALEFLNNEKEIPKQDYELLNFTQDERHKLIKEFLTEIEPKRIEEKNLETRIYSQTAKYSSLNFKSFVLDYIKLSLLARGKLFSEEDYKIILETSEEEVSLKDLVAKVKLR